MIHQLKTEKRYFEDIISGQKSFELRLNDRMYQVGDFLAMNEIMQAGSEEVDYTGRCCLVEIVYMLENERFLQDGYVALGIRPCVIGTTADRMSMCRDDMYAVRIYGADAKKSVE